jgi:hypothetical protein
VTPAYEAIIRHPPLSHQPHLMIPTKGGLRRKYGGTVTRHGFRKGGLVEKALSISDIDWHKLGRFSPL